MFSPDEIQKLLAISHGTSRSSTSNDDLTTLPEISEPFSSEEETTSDEPTITSKGDSDSLKGTYDCQSANSFQINEYPLYEVIKQ